MQPSPHAIELPRWFVETFLDFREDVREARAQGKRLLVYFGQDGCPYCKLLMQTTFTETRVVDLVQRWSVPIALNLWGDREVTWVGGRRMTEKQLGVSSGAYRNEPSFQRFVQSRADRLCASGQAVDLWK
ncbi:MAG: thioredoxin fold domain-containing protein [Burkholderiaceae bacterium]|nr:thioredoxin fold domain-containing protein [Burkholderiaceae bacterium]